MSLLTFGQVNIMELTNINNLSQEIYLFSTPLVLLWKPHCYLQHLSCFQLSYSYQQLYITLLTT